jgi:polysaccharide biosynthesis transport protein
MSVMTTPTNLDESLFRDLYSRLGLGTVTQRKVIGITSSIDGEGKTTMASLLATALARDFAATSSTTAMGPGSPSGPVLLIDYCAGPGSISHALNEEGVLGLAEYLRGSWSIDEVTWQSPEPGLWVIPATGSERDRSVLIRGVDLNERREDLLRHFRAVIVDLPSILASSDTRVLVPFVDELVLVIRSGATRMRLIREAVAAIGEENISGVILNDKRREMPVWLEQRW